MIRASELIGARVCTESGEKLGRVHELRALGGDGEWRLVGLIVGPGGMLARLTGAGEKDPTGAGRVVPWEAVTRVEDGSITVRDVIAAAP